MREEETMVHRNEDEVPGRDHLAEGNSESET